MMRRRFVPLLISSGVIGCAVLLLSSCAALQCVLAPHNTGHAKPETREPQCSRWHDEEPVDGMKVYAAGDPSNPPILLLHELPGLLPETVQLVDALACRGYRVYVPLFFGARGREASTLRQLAVCAGPNFNCLSRRESRVVRKLRVLRDRIAAQHGRKLGIIGMCLTGGMPLALSDERVAAVVLSQPAVPFPLSQRQRRALGVSAQSLDRAKDANVSVLAIRFAQDCLVPPERFDTLAGVIPKHNLETLVVPSTNPREHSVLTVESHSAEARKAIERVYEFLDEHVGRQR